MIKLYNHKKKEYYLETEWNDLSTKKFIVIIPIIMALSQRKVDLQEFRILLFKALTRYQPKDRPYKDDRKETILSNIVVLSDFLRFPVRFEYPEELTDRLSPEAVEKLKKYLPHEIYDDNLMNEIRSIPADTSPIMKLDLDFNRNLLPRFTYRLITYHGPVFNIDKNGIVETDIIADEYVDALSYYNAYLKTGDMVYLNYLLAVLYRKDRSRYNTYDAQKRAARLESVKIEYKYAAYLFIMHLMHFIINKSPFWLLYTRESEESVISSGPEGTIYTLAKTGYGSRKEIGSMLITDYLGMSLDNLVSYIKSAKKSGIKITDIEKETGIDVSIISEI